MHFALSPSLALLSKTRSLKTHSNGSSRSPTGTPPCRRPSGCGPSPSSRSEYRGRPVAGSRLVGKGAGSERGRGVWVLLVPPGGQPHPLPLSLFPHLLAVAGAVPNMSSFPRQPRGPATPAAAGACALPFFVAGLRRWRRRVRDDGRGPAHWWWPRPAAAVEVVGPFRQRPAALAFCFLSSQIGRPSRPGRTWRAGPAWAAAAPAAAVPPLPAGGLAAGPPPPRRCARAAFLRGALLFGHKEQVTWRADHRARLGGFASARKAGSWSLRCGGGRSICGRAENEVPVVARSRPPLFSFLSPPSFFSPNHAAQEKKPTLPAAAGDRISCPGAQT